MILNSPVCLVHSGDIRCAMLVGTGLAFCNYTLIAKFDIIDLVLPPLSEAAGSCLSNMSCLVASCLVAQFE